MIYLDYNGSTPVAPEVRDAMLPYLGPCFGNPSSTHSAGTAMAAAVEQAREQVGNLIGAKPEEIVFTSGGTEANNLALKGVAHAFGSRGRHMIISAIEHPAIVQPCRYLESIGFEITRVGVDRYGLVDPQDVNQEIRENTILISIMHANNEVGTIQPIAEIARFARQSNVLMHTDAAQSCGKIPVSVEELGVDMLTLAGHKFYSPQGIGALYIRSGLELESLHHGAGQERNQRAGTEPVPAIVALGAASALASKQCHAKRMQDLRDRLHSGLHEALGNRIKLNGHPELRLPNTLSISIANCSGGTLLAGLPELCASTGAACHGRTRQISDTLAAMGVSEESAAGTLRLSVGRYTKEEEIDQAVAILVAALDRTA